MTTKDTVLSYFDHLEQKRGWESFLAEDMKFSSFGTPVKHLAGKSEYLESTKRFFSMISKVKLKDLMVDGDKACAISRYELQPLVGPAFESDVAEVFEVHSGRIVSLAIYFDSAPYPKPPSAG